MDTLCTSLLDIWDSIMKLDEYFVSTTTQIVGGLLQATLVTGQLALALVCRD
jgi:hypothetical protein